MYTDSWKLGLTQASSQAIQSFKKKQTFVISPKLKWKPEEGVQHGCIILQQENQSLSVQPGFLSIVHPACASPVQLPSLPPHIVRLPASDKASLSLTQRAHARRRTSSSPWARRSAFVSTKEIFSSALAEGAPCCHDNGRWMCQLTQSSAFPSL